MATNEATKVVNNRGIRSRHFMLQHMTAVMLLDKTVTFHSAHDTRAHERPRRAGSCAPKSP